MARAPRTAIVALMAAGVLVACTGDAAQPEASPDGAATTSPDERDLAAALEDATAFAQCMRDNGVPTFADPVVRADGDFALEPPADVSDDELRPAWETCEQLRGVRDDPATSTDDDTLAAEWARVALGGDCRCADGSEFAVWVRPAATHRVAVYFQDGGACFSAETCDPESGRFRSTVGDGPAGERGIFDLADPRNPFADHSIVYVPYCTGDVHLGNITREYRPGLTVQHAGAVNGDAALDLLVDRFPMAERVVVLGESAGSAAAPFYAGLVADRLPDARVTVLGDGSGSYADQARLNEIIAGWGFAGAVPPRPESAGVTAGQWSFPGLTVHAGRHDHDIVFARHDYAADPVQTEWNGLAGMMTPNLLTLIDATERGIEAEGVRLLSYLAPGDAHTVLSDGSFYTEEVEGVRFVDWVTRLVEGDQVEDVRCTDCGSR